jgi:hypothetical protein
VNTIRSAVLALLLLIPSATALAAGKPAELWVHFQDEPTGIVPHKKGYRVFFAHHAAVYYLLKSDPALKKDLETIRRAIRGEKPVSVEAEATYLYLRHVALASE